MAKKNEAPAYEVPNYESFTTIEDVEEEIDKYKGQLVGKDIVEYRMKDDKKNYVAAINEQLKELKEEREHCINVISGLEQQKQLIANGGSAPGAVIVPIRPAAGGGN